MEQQKPFYHAWASGVFYNDKFYQARKPFKHDEYGWVCADLVR